MKPNQIPKDLIDEVERRVVNRLHIEEIKEINLLREYDAMFRELGYIGLTWIGAFSEYNLENEEKEARLADGCYTDNTPSP